MKPLYFSSGVFRCALNETCFLSLHNISGSSCSIPETLSFWNIKDSIIHCTAWISHPILHSSPPLKPRFDQWCEWSHPGVFGVLCFSLPPLLPSLSSSFGSIFSISFRVLGSGGRNEEGIDVSCWAAVVHIGWSVPPAEETSGSCWSAVHVWAIQEALQGPWLHRPLTWMILHNLSSSAPCPFSSCSLATYPH